MQTTVQRTESNLEDLERFLALEIDKARAKARPISRVTLSRRLHDEHGLPIKEAEEFVEAFCDEHEPAVPEYLSSEFGTPYLKVIAVINVLIAISFLVMAVRFSGRGQGLWMGLGLGGLFLVGAGFAWVNSLRKPDEPKSTAGFRRY